MVEKAPEKVNLKNEECHCYDNHTTADWANYYPCPHRQDLQHQFRRDAEYQYMEDMAS